MTKRFGKLVAIKNISFQVSRGSITGLIGPNGSGKTTIFNLISGFLKPDSGKISLDGTDITGMRPSRIAGRGLVRSFQLTSVYRDMTVFENVLMGHHMCRPGGRRAGSPALPGQSADVTRSTEYLLHFMGLAETRDAPACLLPGGTQRTLSIATSLAARPAILLLDEPLAGLNSTEKSGVIAKLAELRKLGLTIFIIEHDMKSVMSVCDELCVINFGEKIGQGTPAEVMSNPTVIEAYLGSASGAHA